LASLEVSELFPLFFCVLFPFLLVNQVRLQQCKLPRSCAGPVSDSTFFCLRRTPPSSSYALALPCLKDALFGSPRISSVLSAWARIFISQSNSIYPRTLWKRGVNLSLS